MRTQVLPENKLRVLIRPWEKVESYEGMRYIRRYYLDHLSRYTAATVKIREFCPGEWEAYGEWAEDARDDSLILMRIFGFLLRFYSAEDAMTFMDKKLEENGYILMEKEKYIGLF